MLRKPSLRVDPNAVKEKDTPPPLPSNPDYPHNSVFRSSQLEVHVRSPSVKIHRAANYEIRALPVFGDHDKVTGKVLLDVGLCSTPGRLTILLQGSFVFTSPNVDRTGLDDYIENSHSAKNRHVFFTSVDSRPTGDFDTPRSATSLRDAFTASVRVARRVERRPSQTNISGALRPFHFFFEIPRSELSGQELPPSFSSIAEGEVGARARLGVERAEVSYTVTAIWEAADGSDRVLVDAPIIYQPDPDFQSFDGLAMQTESWLEIPLKADRQLPITCAVTLPSPATFLRKGSVSYFVVFTTYPRSSTLAREIASDATISVSLVREVRIDAITPRGGLSPSLTSSTPSTSSDESDLPPVASRRLLERVVRSVPRTRRRALSLTRTSSRKEREEKPLPQLPSPGVYETRVLQTDMCVGFPKRPRYRMDPHQRHPSLESHKALPDGLYKGKIQLDKAMLPAFDWAGLCVKYYLEVSVIFGQDQMRARVPVRIL
ncbi:hypothetical protein C8Q74DRAFT_222201 [Fomes fomentarius]|nr:hypothetical protein C8Q74DRAFT_222201 [Fomes fomentarius]